MISQELIVGAIIGTAATCGMYAIVLFLGDRQKYRLLNCTAYCYECQIEMPVKQHVKTGLTYCTNCGTLHTQSN